VTTRESGPPIAVAGRGFDQPRTMATILGGLFLAGETIGAFSLVLPHPSEFETPELWSNAAKAAGRDRVIGT
jgi:hypothetical protein